MLEVDAPLNYFKVSAGRGLVYVMANQKTTTHWTRTSKTQLFLQTGKKNSPYEDNLDKSARKPPPRSVWIDRLGTAGWEELEALSGTGEVYSWGVEAGKRNIKARKRMVQGNQLFLLLGSTLELGFRILRTWKDEDLSEAIWGTRDWPLVYALAGPVKYDIPKIEILEALEYSDGSIRGLTRPRETANVPQFRELLQGRGGLP